MVKDKVFKVPGLPYSRPEVYLLLIEQTSVLCESTFEDSSVERVSDEDWSLII